MATYTIYAGTADGLVYSNSATYSDARNNLDAGSTNTTGITSEIGQRLNLVSVYFAYQLFFSFVVDIPGDEEVTAQQLDFWMAGSSSTATWDLEARQHQWTAPLSRSDFVAGTALSTKPLFGSTATLGLSTTAYTTITRSGTADLSANGTAFVMLSSSRQRLGDVPTTSEYITLRMANYSGTTNDPKLTITTIDRPWRLYVDSVDRAPLSDIANLRISDAGPNTVGRLQASVANTTGTATVPAGAEVELRDTYDDTVWQGVLASRRLAPAYASGNFIELEATDLNVLLDRVYITDDSIAVGSTDREAVQYLIDTYGTAVGLTASTATVELTKQDVDDVSFVNDSLRQALQLVVDSTQSSDPSGVSWVQATVTGLGTATPSFNGLTYDGTAWRTVRTVYGGTPSPAYTYYTSTDAYTWATAGTAPYSVIYYRNGSYYGRNSDHFLGYSSDLTTWGSARVVPATYTSGYVTGLAYGAGTYVASAYAYTSPKGYPFVAYSTSGTAWSTATITGAGTASNTLNDVTYANGTFVAVGGEPTPGSILLTSTTGTAFSTAASVPLVDPLYGVAYGNSTWVAVGDYGAILSATNAAGTWTTRTAPSSRNRFRAVTYWTDASLFVATTLTGGAATSADGITWTDQETGLQTLALTYLASNGEKLVGANEAIGVTEVQDTRPRYFYVDQLGQIHYGFLADSVAPYAISDAPNGTTSIAPSDLEIDYDESAIVNAVWVATADDPAPTYGEWITDATSIATYGRREAVYITELVVDANSAETYGRAYLATRKDPAVRGSFTVTNKDGWQAGQTVTITNAALGLSAATYLITQVDTDFLTGTAIRRYRISFGALPKSLVGALAAGS